MLLGLLRYDFHGDQRAALDEFEVMVRAYEKSSGETLSESMKVVFVQKGLRDEALRSHLVMHAARLDNYAAVRDEVRSILLTRHALQSAPVAMDIGAVGTHGKGGKDGKGKGKDSDKPAKGK